jgi:hypothetical protein
MIVGESASSFSTDMAWLLSWTTKISLPKKKQSINLLNEFAFCGYLCTCLSHNGAILKASLGLNMPASTFAQNSAHTLSGR